MTSSGLKDLVLEVPDSDFRVNRRVFTDDAILDAERRSILLRHWVYVGHTSEIPEPGDFVTRRVVGEALILNRDRHGEVHVFFNSCRHRGAIVCPEPSGTANQFRCFYHQWTYRDSGELIGVPDKIAFPDSFDQSCSGLVSPRYEIYRDFVFACFNPDAPTLVEYLGGVRPYLDSIVDQSIDGKMEVVAGSHLYSMRGNWKLIVENSIDGYHALPVHVTYFQFMMKQGYDMSGGLEGAGRSLGNGHAVLDYVAPVGRSSARAVPVMNESTQAKIRTLEEAQRAKHGDEVAELITQHSKNILIYPNLIIIDGASLQVRTLDPITPNYTEVNAWALAPVGEDPELREHRARGYLEFLGPGGLATPDDNEAVEACQIAFGALQGAEWSILSKGMHRDECAVTDEEQLRGFWRQWQADMARHEQEG